MLHASEETLDFLPDSVLEIVPSGRFQNPISDYFDVTSRLKAKLVGPAFSADSELLGLMMIGIVSAAEFYFRTVLGRCVDLCPLSLDHAGAATVPIGAFRHYHDSDYSYVIGSMEHESLAGADSVRGAVKKFTGLDPSTDSSLRAALDEFGILCELRHCLAHSRGFLGSKNRRTLGLRSGTFSKILIRNDSALELLKLAHNSVRAVNRFLSNGILDRWIDKDVLRGKWREDRNNFLAWWNSFVILGEDGFGGNVQLAYKPIRAAIQKRRQAMPVR